MAPMSIGEYKLVATPRDQEARPAILRGEGKLPAVLYGHHIEPQALALDAVEFGKVYHKAGASSLINIEIAGNDNQVVLVKQAQHDPVRGQVTHVDLYAVSMTEKIKAEIPLVFEGVAPAVEDHDAILVTNKDHVEVECLPSDLPHDIKVDISVLANIDDSITVADIKVPAGVEILDDATETIVIASEQREEEPEEAPVSEAEAVAAVEATAEKPADETEAK
jgi:large subunit ribosomal protein L25